MVKAGDIIIVNLNPTLGQEKGKKRPCLVVSQSPFNIKTKFAWVLPITSRKVKYPTDVSCLTDQDNVHGVIDCGQIRALDLSYRPFQVVDKIKDNSMVAVQEIISTILGIDLAN